MNQKWNEIEIDQIEEEKTEKKSKHPYVDEKKDHNYASIADAIDFWGIKIAQKRCRRGLTDEEVLAGQFAAFDYYMTIKNEIEDFELMAKSVKDACVNAFLGALRLSTKKYDRGQLIDDAAEKEFAAKIGKKYSPKMFYRADIEKNISSLAIAGSDDDCADIDDYASNDSSSIDAMHAMIERFLNESDDDRILEDYREAARKHMIRLDNDAILSDDDQRKILAAVAHNDNMLTTPETIAQLLSCSDRTVRNMIADNRLQKVEDGGGSGKESLFIASPVHAERVKIIDRKFGTKNKIDIADLSLIWRSANA